MNLSTGEEEYKPAPDLTVYNPHGPSVVWQRVYNSLRGQNTFPYEYDDFGNSWSQTYNVGVWDPSYGGTGSGNTKYVLMPNGGRVPFTAPSVPTASSPKVACAVQAGAAMLVEWDYDASSPIGHYTITMADRTRWITTTEQASTVYLGAYDAQYGVSYYQLAQIVDRNGNAINFNYVPSPNGSFAWASGYPLLSTITDAGTGLALLTITRNGYSRGGSTNPQYGNITAVTDCYGRSVYYQGAFYGSASWSAEVTQVSEVVPTGAPVSPPARYSYGYAELDLRPRGRALPVHHHSPLACRNRHRGEYGDDQL